jgi:hypothetical protein
MYRIYEVKGPVTSDISHVTTTPDGKMSHDQLVNRLLEVGRRIFSMKADVLLCKWSVQHLRIVAYTSPETPSIMLHMDYNSRRQHRCSSSGCNFVRLDWGFVRALQAEVRSNIEIFWGEGEIFINCLGDAWFEVSAAMWMISALFWDLTQRRVVIP